MHTLGHSFVPPRIHAGGLRYHGAAATLSVLLDSGLVEPRAVDQVSTFQAGEIFAKTEGLIPAPETCHAIRGAVDPPPEAKGRKEATTIAFNYSGPGFERGGKRPPEDRKSTRLDSTHPVISFAVFF